MRRWPRIRAGVTPKPFLSTSDSPRDGGGTAVSPPRGRGHGIAGASRSHIRAWVHEDLRRRLRPFAGTVQGPAKATRLAAPLRRRTCTQAGLVRSRPGHVPLWPTLAVRGHVCATRAFARGPGRRPLAGDDCRGTCSRRRRGKPGSCDCGGGSHRAGAFLGWSLLGVRDRLQIFKKVEIVRVVMPARLHVLAQSLHSAGAGLEVSSPGRVLLSGELFAGPDVVNAAAGGRTGFDGQNPVWRPRGTG